VAPRRSSAITHTIELLPLLFRQDLSDLFAGLAGDLPDLASGPFEDLSDRNPLIFVQSQFFVHAVEAATHLGGPAVGVPRETTRTHAANTDDGQGRSTDQPQDEDDQNQDQPASP
jgi:hypothetical protein